MGFKVFGGTPADERGEKWDLRHTPPSRTRPQLTVQGREHSGHLGWPDRMPKPQHESIHMASPQGMDRPIFFRRERRGEKANPPPPTPHKGREKHPPRRAPPDEPGVGWCPPRGA